MSTQAMDEEKGILPCAKGFPGQAMTAIIKNRHIYLMTGDYGVISGILPIMSIRPLKQMAAIWRFAENEEYIIIRSNKCHFLWKGMNWEKP